MLVHAATGRLARGQEQPHHRAEPSSLSCLAHRDHSMWQGAL